ncbi:transposable element Tcb2 transposase [Trichonephila clavipes]|nr:transposable element Tcb2 transposase [Trichonephila clavipes]
MIWDMFYWHGKCALEFLKGKQAVMRELNMLVDQVHPAMLHFYLDGNRYFMDDSATTHPAQSVQNWFAEHRSDFQHLPLPQHSPNLNPIENVWDMVEKCIQQHSPLQSNSQDLKACIANEWYSLDVNALHKHVDSMPK